MRTFVPAFLERAIPRLFSACLMLLVARMTSPYEVGIYAYAVIAYTAVMAATDSGGRQVVIRALTEPDGAPFLRRYEVLVPILGIVVVGGALVWLRVSGVAGHWGVVWDLTPFVVAPLFTALCLRHVGLLMATAQWRALARGQLVASIVSVAVATPVLFWTHSLLGPALQTLVAEMAFYLFCRWRARGVDTTALTPAPPDVSIGRDMIGMSAYGLVAWAQGQAERVFVGVLAGTDTLGRYNTGAALGRAPGDALGASTANVARTAVASASSPADVRKLMERTLNKSLVLALLAPATTVVAAILLRRFLGPSWGPALDIVPILSLTAFPSVLAWSATVLQMKAGKAVHALWAPVVGIAMAAIIAWAATYSLELAAYCVVIREVVVVAVAFAIARAWAPWRSFAISTGLVALGTVACLLWIGW